MESRNIFLRLRQKYYDLMKQGDINFGFELYEAAKVCYSNAEMIASKFLKESKLVKDARNRIEECKDEQEKRAARYASHTDKKESKLGRHGKAERER